MPSGKWRAIAVDLDEEELGDEIFSLIEDEELDPGDIVPVIGPGGSLRPSGHPFLCPRSEAIPGLGPG